jgi:hypothetical protein
VVVGGAAKLVGKKVKARIAAVSDGLAWAELLSPLDQPQEPLTAESEAERPTRARRAPAKKAAEPEAAEVADEPVAEEPVEGEEAQAAPKKRTRRGTRGGKNRKKKTAAAAGPVVLRPIIHIPERGLGETETEAGSDGGEAVGPAKKKTRRGSRGGRNRRKKTVAATASPNGSEPVAVEQTVDEAPADEWTYTPMSEWGLEDE